ncbi:hypothetical protein [Sinomonas albida]|uniref:hypothetical protein n=1 Tax=Sinomonas albida TaxID=369942 RepID=UPI00301AC5D6
MSDLNPRSWLDRVAGACLSILLAALALWCATQVLQSILPFLITAVGIVTIAWAVWVLVRWLRDRC